MSGKVSVGRGDESGFTLLELIVVTALMGIMMSLSVPSMRNSFFTDPLKSSTRKMIGLVSGVRAQAVRSHQPFLLHISQSDNKIWYEREMVEGEGGKDKSTSFADDIPLNKQLVFPESVHVSGVWVGRDDDPALDDMEVWISAQGLMIDTIVQLEDDDGNHLNVQFYPFLAPEIVGDEILP